MNIGRRNIVARPADQNPTGLELEILKILWQESPLAVGEIRDRLAGAGRDNAHTSVITMLNIMVDKGFLEKRKQGRGFFYWPVVTLQETTGKMLNDLVERAFEGSARQLMLSLLEQQDGIDEAELIELRQLINRKVREQRGS
jgi:predicted transcriptional regulator